MADRGVARGVLKSARGGGGPPKTSPEPLPDEKIWARRPRRGSGRGYEPQSLDSAPSSTTAWPGRKRSARSASATPPRSTAHPVSASSARRPIRSGLLHWWAPVGAWARQRGMPIPFLCSRPVSACVRSMWRRAHTCDHPARPALRPSASPARLPGPGLWSIRELPRPLRCGHGLCGVA